MSVRIIQPRTNNGVAIDAASNIQAYQILPMPVEVNPGYVRHTGLNTANRNVPRALFPLATDGGDIKLTALRDPTQPTNSLAGPNGNSALLWVDLYVPSAAAPGQYEGRCELVDSNGRASGSPVPISLSVYDFALPAERHLQMVGSVAWDRLAALYPASFGDSIIPNLINRHEARYAKTVRLLDQLMSLSEANQMSLIVPGLRPTVKWPANEPPQIDWHEFDSLIGPWMRGETFADHRPAELWPVPSALGLDRYDARSRLDYWSEAAAHFDQLGWLPRSVVWPFPESDGGASDPRQLFAEAAQLLSRHSQVRVALPVDDQQVEASQVVLDNRARQRLLTAGASLISSIRPPPIGPVPNERTHWLSTDLPGLIPYCGAGGDERDVRVWAWLAFLRRAQFVLWDRPLPAADNPAVPADPSAMIWFYPGEWFGVTEPLPTLQLKWLRRAAQDYEYLWLAKQRGEVITALQMARLITKPVEVAPGQDPDPAYALMSGTTIQEAWDQARELLAKTILSRRPGEPADPARENALAIQTLQWAQPQERPLLLPRETDWAMVGPRKDRRSTVGGNWVALRLGVDIYNASDTTPDRNALRWAPPATDSGWEMQPREVQVPKLQTYQVLPAAMLIHFNLDALAPQVDRPLEVRFRDGYHNKESGILRIRLPVAASDRRDAPLKLDGQLDDWTDADAIQDGPLVLMLNRPDVQNQQLRFAPVRSKMYSGWGVSDFFLAFALDGLSPLSTPVHNDVHYQSRRTWDEDLCEVLIQGVYPDNTLGPVVHVVCKPGGAVWVERKAVSDGGWGPIEGAVRYATTTTPDGRWRGEAAIPWTLISPNKKHRPVLLRFNFSQNRQATCESASWAGPVDFGRDARFTGLLYLRTPSDIGIAKGDGREDAGTPGRRDAEKSE